MDRLAPSVPFGLVDGDIDTVSLFSSVLLVEDDSAHSHLIKRALRGLVGEVVCAGTADEACQIISSTYLELVICDLHLPDLSGAELLERLCKARPGLPVIVMTASSRLDDAVEVMRVGAWDYMVKEFNDSFRDRLQLVVTRSGKRQVQQMRELQVRAERDAFSAAVRAASDGVAVLDDFGKVVFANDSFDEFVKLAQGDVALDQPADVPQVVSALDERAADEFRSQLEHSGGDVLWQTELRSEHDNVRHFELTLTSTKLGDHDTVDAALELRRFVLWVRDISAKKEREKFQRDLLATTSHDLKGPLGAILTSVELLDRPHELPQRKAEELITRIGSCARGCVTLIDELLSARRIQDGVLVVRPRFYLVRDMLEEAVLDFQPMAKARSLNLQYSLADEQIKIFADKLGLHRVISNLVSNAIKFSDAGGEIELSASRHGDEVSIQVRDTGSGITPEERPYLFDRYTRLDKHAAVDGTGLGLYVAKSIIDAHDGRIEVRSELGVGTTFIITLPDGEEIR